MSLDRKETLNYLPAGVNLSQTDKSMEVMAMCWDNQSQDQVNQPWSCLLTSGCCCSCMLVCVMEQYAALTVEKNTAQQI